METNQDIYNKAIKETGTKEEQQNKMNIKVFRNSDVTALTSDIMARTFCFAGIMENWKRVEENCLKVHFYIVELL